MNTVSRLDARIILYEPPRVFFRGCFGWKYFYYFVEMETGAGFKLLKVNNNIFSTSVRKFLLFKKYLLNCFLRSALMLAYSSL
jgi:hypothetical protein